MIRYLRTLTTLFVIVIVASVQCIKLEEKYAWQELEFAWPSEEIKQKALASGAYKVENNLPLGLDVWNDKLFITVPRFVFKIKYTLGHLSIINTRCTYVYTFYDDWHCKTVSFSWKDCHKCIQNIIYTIEIVVCSRGQQNI